MSAITLKNTKAELFAEVLRLQVALADAQRFLAAVTSDAPVIVATLVVEPRPFMDPDTAGIPTLKGSMPQWQVERAAAMAKARSQAMGTGHSVKV